MHSRSESTTVGSVIWIALFTLMVLGGCSPVEGPPRAINGYMDLSEGDFEKDGIVELKGQWEIYWHKLLSPDDFSTIVPPDKTGYFPVPKKWDGKVVDGVRLSPQGHATLKLKVRLPAVGLPDLARRSHAAGRCVRRQ